MENEIQKFENAEFGSVRTVDIDGVIHFVGKDVANALGYTNARKAIADHVDEEDKGVTKCDTLGGTQEMTVINESGLYSLVLSSKLPNAKKFKKWVTSEILPSIRKTGSYSVQDNFSELSPQLQYLITLEKKQNQLEKKQAELEQKIKDVENNNDETIKAAIEYGRISLALQKQLAKNIKFKVLDICKYSETYDACGKKIESRINKALQRKFNVTSYKELRYNQYVDALIFIDVWEPDINTQVVLSKAFPKPRLDIFEAFANVQENDSLK